MLRKEGDKIILCCGGKACPKLSINEENNVIIEDDDGSTVVITKAQASLISQALEQV
jgi:hypothetical protein